MADYTTAVNRSETSASLQTWLYRNTLENFMPNLFFWLLGEKPMKQKGYNTLAWAKYSIVDPDNITAGSTTTDGVSPTPLAFTATVISKTPVQYVATISISDMVADFQVLDFIAGALKELGDAMSKRIDKVIQTEVTAGTNVIYANGKTARTALASTDVLTASLFNKADAYLQAKNAPKINGHYVAVIHPFQLADLRAETGTGNWLEVNKYAKPDVILNGEIGMLNGVRIMVSSYVQTFASTATVYPAMVLGKGAFGVADFKSLQTFLVPFGASDSDPAAQRAKVSTKIAFGAKRLQEDAMLRIETGATALF